MSPAWIRTRSVTISTRNPKGKSYQVLYRRGGRGYKIETAGTFKTQTEAKLRRDLVAGWLAAGLDPRDETRKLELARVQPKTRQQWADDFLASLHDVSEKTTTTYRYGIAAAFTVIEQPHLDLVTIADCELAVATLAAKYAPKTVSSYWTAFQLLLDYVGVDPNPARNRRVKLPRLTQTPPTPPPADHVEKMLGRISSRYLLPAVFVEQTAIRVESIESTTWGNVDVDGSRIRVTEKGRKVRFIPVPGWLMRMLEDTCAVEDRSTDRRLFPAATSNGLRYAMATACKHAGIPHYHPHDLRHRRATLWHLQGVPARVVSDRVGHATTSLTLNTYTHVMPIDEVPEERLVDLVAGATR